MEKILKLHINNFNLKNLLMHAIFVVEVLFNLLLVFLLYTDIPLIRDGAMVKLFDEPSNVWFYKSVENMVLRDELIIFISLTTVLLAMCIVMRRIKLACIIQLLPILILLGEQALFF